jgi:phosphate-selective porin OprO and OprP
MKRKSLLLTLVFNVCLIAAFGQVRSVSGRVTSSKDSSPVGNVEVRLKGAINAVLTDGEGIYIIQVPDNSTDVLLFSHPDFDDVEIFLNNKTGMDITMIENIRFNQYNVRVNRNTLFTEERNGILVHESKTMDYRMWFDIRVQADGAMFFGEPLNPIGNGTSIRRARFASKVEFARHWFAEFDLDIANSELELKDAYLQYTFNNRLELKVGNFKEGFSMESTTTSRYLTFMERPMAVNAFAPSRHVGFTAAYMKDWMLFIGGIHFQAVDDPKARLFSKDNNKDYGTDEGVSWTGRLVTMPFFDDPYKGLHFGVAGSLRTPKTDTEVLQSLRFDTRSLTSINRKKYLDTDMIDNIDYSTLTGFEIAGYRKNLRLQAEYLMSSVHRQDDLPTENFDGFYVFGSWILFGGKYNYNTMEGEFTQVDRGKEWGDFELALRYDYLNLNSGFDKTMGGAGEGITLGLNYYANNNVKIMLNYAYLNHDRYASGKNRLFVGYDTNGELTTDPQLVADAQGKAGNDYHMVSIRFEVDF